MKLVKDEIEIWVPIDRTNIVIVGIKIFER